MAAVFHQVAPAPADLRDLEILLRAHHPLIVLDTGEVDRARVLVEWVADRMGLPLLTWDARGGLCHADLPDAPIAGSQEPVACLDHILRAKADALYFLPHFERFFDDDAVVQQLQAAAHRLFATPSAIILPGAELALPDALLRLQTTVRLSALTREQYYQFLQTLLADLQRRMPIAVRLSSDEVSLLLNQLQGLTLFEVKKILTRLIVERGSFGPQDIPKVAEAKRDIVARSGVLEYFTPAETMATVAGLENLKQWLGQRKQVFARPAEARAFGLTPPRGILLLGAPGCGKSLSAKATAAEWQLPLIRLDPSSLYSKYFGESEKNLKRAIRMAEDLAPVVLWIDELEKALSQGGKDNDSGTGARIFGTFLSWLQEKKDGVFVIATANDIDRLPPELLRKGRFDEIFFVDLPDAAARQEILSVHLRKRGRNPADFDLQTLADHLNGFSGAEIEQVVVSSLFTAFSNQEPLTDRLIVEEILRTVPLSVTAAEKVAALRAWAQTRAVPAD